MAVVHTLRVLSRPAAPSAALATIEALLGPEPRDFDVHLWTGETLPPTGGQRARFTLVLRHPDTMRRMFWPPSELSLGEAFVRGDFDVEGDLVAAFDLRERLSPSPRLVARLAASLPALLARDAGATEEPSRAAHLGGLVHGRRRDAAAVRHHYDVGNDFYALWLDRRMVYSCAYFPTPEATLDAAQEAKLELLCRKLRLRPGQRLLDVGCGWGGLVQYAAEHHGVQAVGITLSPSQAELARVRVAGAGLAERCRIEIVDYRDLRDEPFDAVVSVGMVEHVGGEQLPTYFRALARLVKPGGVVLNHGISRIEPPTPAWLRLLTGSGKFVRRYVFPDSDLPPVHATAAAALDAGLELRDVESLREHYALTLRHWLARLEARRDEAIAAAGEEIYRIWRLYLAGSAADFDKASIGVYQALYVKPAEGGRSGLPLGREGWYARPLLRAAKARRSNPGAA